MPATDLTRIERTILGVLAFVICALPLVVGLGGLALFFLPVTVPDSMLKWGFIAVIIAVGLQFPMMLIIGGVIGEDGPKFSLHTFSHPFKLFELWWRYIR